jgi:hypothetical protein
MKGKINEDGRLEIFGRGKQYCPFCRNSGGQKEECGNWCPLFGEPEYIRATTVYYNVKISLCKKTLYFESFEDKSK